MLAPVYLFLKRAGHLPELRCLWSACTGTSDEQTRPGSEPPSSTRGVNYCVLLGVESHLGPVRYEWLYRIAPQIIETLKLYHDDNVGTQSAGFCT